MDNAGVGVSNETCQSCQSPFPLNRWRAAGLLPQVGSIRPGIDQGQSGLILHLHLKEAILMKSSIGHITRSHGSHETFKKVHQKVDTEGEAIKSTYFLGSVCLMKNELERAY